jgi:DNA mismatch repair protein MutL
MKIRLLNETTINKIAAGEVVENPAAVVKELVENAIDASASAVTVEIENGGIKKIRVADNGSGIASAEVPLAVERHATSKIFDYRDLDNIGTLGFRGEALSSIAAVSMMEIATKTRDQEMGVIASVEGGAPMNVKAAGLPNGTTVTVKNLFFNTPARFKFLKSAGQEAASVTDIILKLILSHPEVSFRYVNNGETVYHSSGSGLEKDALICTFGKDILGKIAPLEHTYEGIRVHGFVGLPQFALKSRRSQYFIVNGRTIQGQNLSYYIQNAYSQRLLKGQYPFVLLYMHLDFNATDVNVHPSKLTIRFRDEGKIAYMLGEAVSDALAKKPIAGVLHIQAEKPKPDKTILEETVPGEAGQPASHAEPPLSETELPEIQAKPPVSDTQPYAAGGPAFRKEAASQVGFFSGTQGKGVLHADDGKFYDVLIGLEQKEEEKASKAEEPEHEEALLAAGTYKVVGQVFSSYILLECQDKLLMLDQHAAHERLLFDGAVKAYESGESLSTALLMPEIARVTHADKLLLNENMEILNRIGFEMEEFGPLEYRVTAIPYLFKGIGMEAMLDEVAGELRRGGKEKPLLRAQSLMKAACKKAIKANMRLNDKEIGIIIEDYLSSGAMPTCPHGRPILTVITRAEIEKGFKRRV